MHLFLHNRIRWPELQGGGCTCIGAQIAWEKPRNAGHLNKAPGQVILLTYIIHLTIYLTVVKTCSYLFKVYAGAIPLLL